MRHPLVPALLLVTVLLGFAIGGAVLVAATPAAASAGPAEAAPGASATPASAALTTPTQTSTPAQTETTVSGTVTYPNGTAATEAYVLLGSEAMFMKRSPDELLEVARSDPQDPTVVRPDADGSFSVETNAEAVVAVSPFGMSEVHRAEGEVDLTLHPQRPLRFHVADGWARPGNTTPLYLDLPNTGDEPVEDLKLTVDLPPGWTVVTTATNGQFHPGNNTFTWSNVSPGEWAEARLTVRVPADAELATHEVGLSAESRTHPVSAPAGVIEVREETPDPTITPTSLPDERTGGPASNGTDSPRSSPTSQPVPGFGLAPALLALLSAAALRARRD